MKPDFSIVTEFEKRVAQFFGASFAVAVDSATHGVELSIRYRRLRLMTCPKHTYLSIPFLAEKLDIHLVWKDEDWKDYYLIGNGIYDAAVLWRKDSYIQGSLMSISFQYQKHLSLGRGGVILCSTQEEYDQLKKMSYDGRIPGIPWRDQDIDCVGFHYYMTPETASLGLEKLQDAIDNRPRQWQISDWPDLTQMKIFKK